MSGWKTKQVNYSYLILKQPIQIWVVFRDLKYFIGVNTLIAIPYNPYEPKPYTRWTMRGMIDLENELKVGKEFWDFIGGEGTYEDLLGCFERVGIELRGEIDNYFKKFKLSR